MNRVESEDYLRREILSFSWFSSLVWSSLLSICSYEFYKELLYIVSSWNRFVRDTFFTFDFFSLRLNLWKESLCTFLDVEEHWLVRFLFFFFVSKAVVCVTEMLFFLCSARRYICTSSDKEYLFSILLLYLTFL